MISPATEEAGSPPIPKRRAVRAAPPAERTTDQRVVPVSLSTSRSWSFTRGEGAEPAALDDLAVPIIVTSSHQGELIHRQQLPWPCAWALGHEGQGVSEALLARATLCVRIAQPGGEESLNVAAAAAICLYAARREVKRR